jgi:hypothetical protein
MTHSLRYTKVYPKVSGLAAWSENCKWYSSLPLVQLYRYFASQSSELCRNNPLCCFSTSQYQKAGIYFIIDSVRKLFDIPSYIFTYSSIHLLCAHVTIVTMMGSTRAELHFRKQSSQLSTCGFASN